MKIKPEKSNKDNELISLEIKSPKKEYDIGESIEITTAIKNISDKPLLLVGVLDGSETASRYPFFIPEISGNYKVPLNPRCGMLRIIREKNFVLVEPGMSFNPEMEINDFGFYRLWAFSSFKPDLPDEFKIKLKYSTDSTQPKNWLGHGVVPNLDKILRMIEEVPKLTVESNVLVISVK